MMALSFFFMEDRVKQFPNEIRFVIKIILFFEPCGKKLIAASYLSIRLA
jgi:hypothetical protein